MTLRQTVTNDDPTLQLLLTPEEAARALRIGRTRLYHLISTGQLASVKIGGSRRITVDALRDYIGGIVDATEGGLRRSTHTPAGCDAAAVGVTPPVHTGRASRQPSRVRDHSDRSRSRRRPPPNGGSGETLPLPFP